MVYKGIFQECVNDSTNTTFHDCFRVEPLLPKKHFKSSHQTCSTKKVFLQNSQNPQETPVPECIKKETLIALMVTSKNNKPTRKICLKSN